MIQPRLCIIFIFLAQFICASTAFSQNDYADAMLKINPRLGQPMEIDEDRVAANGIRRLSSKHLVLYTDIRERPEINEFPAVFDQAISFWCGQFSIDPQRAVNWQMRCFLMEDVARFEAAELIPDDLPSFLAGYQRRHEMWIYLQPGKYYTRHLLLHEGNHAFMQWFLNGFGSPWYSEGMSEMVGVHHWHNNQLTMNYRLRDRTESDYWGRVKIIREEFADDISLSLDDVMDLPGTGFREVRSYAWAWAACKFLSEHPLSQSGFSGMYKKAELTLSGDRRSFNRFNSSVKSKLRKNWSSLNRDWQLFLSEMDYGIDVRKSRLLSAATKTINAKSVAAVRADHGWQKTTIAVKPGDRIRITCGSRFQIGQSGQPTQPWPCEANGITLEYYQGRPLGMLLAGVIEDFEKKTEREKRESKTVKAAISGLLDPIGVGRDAVIEIETEGTLCLRVNDSPARMDDNKGVLEVIVEKLE